MIHHRLFARSGEGAGKGRIGLGLIHTREEVEIVHEGLLGEVGQMDQGRVAEVEAVPIVLYHKAQAVLGTGEHSGHFGQFKGLMHAQRVGILRFGGCGGAGST